MAEISQPPKSHTKKRIDCLNISFHPTTLSKSFYQQKEAQIILFKYSPSQILYAFKKSIELPVKRKCPQSQFWNTTARHSCHTGYSSLLRSRLKQSQLLLLPLLFVVRFFLLS